MAAIRIVEEGGSFLLVEGEGRWAVVERRAGRLYPLDPDRVAEDGAPDTPDGLARAADPGWTDEATARRCFAAMVGRGEHLARTIW
ncbi:hypothetical protein [Arenibaculum pallidiluteum]|uniref:hypothetical protein n=1 Tax=Arenibaculum pallidiluteum TaxID=2812559 RepID=UPI001A961947|nr:hypothetical protein [Arenibaculum pallidiluteum]